MTMQYRSTGKDDPWHFCQNCTHWPKSDFDALAFANPPLCKECEALCDSLLKWLIAVPMQDEWAQSRERDTYRWRASMIQT